MAASGISNYAKSQETTRKPGIPKWQCHKIVEAFKITTISCDLLMDDYGNSAAVSEEYFAKHHPEAGGYYVRYEDGYESFSPAEAFEKGYSLMGNRSKLEEARELLGRAQEELQQLRRENELASARTSVMDNFFAVFQRASSPHGWPQQTMGAAEDVNWRIGKFLEETKTPAPKE